MTRQSEIDRMKTLTKLWHLSVTRKSLQEWLVDHDIGTKDRFEIVLGSKEYEYEKVVKPIDYKEKDAETKEN